MVKSWIPSAVFLGLAKQLASTSDVCDGAVCEEDSALLQTRHSSDSKESSASEMRTFWFTPHQEFKEPPEVRPPMTLTVDTARLCAPRIVQGWWGTTTTEDTCWSTRVYGTDTIAPGLPGPTIRVKPGETLSVLLKNKLKNPTPGKAWGSLSEVYDLNSTSLHTHGLHISGDTGNDDVWVHIPPGQQKQYDLKVLDYHMAGTHWYHPHSHHSTSVQAGGGLHGALIVDDPPNSLPPQIANMEEKVMVISLVDASNVAHTNSVYGMPVLEALGQGNLWKNQKGEYVNFEEVAVLVNGQYKPKLKITSGKWYRFRMIYGTVELLLRAFPWFSVEANCEMQLLAKDGIYLHEAPRKVDYLYFASGNRVDVAFRCSCVGTESCESHLVSAAVRPEETLSKTRQDVDKALERFQRKGDYEDGMGEPKSGALQGVSQKVIEQELVHFDISPAEPEAPLEPFKTKRPCYLVDLRTERVPPSNQGRVELMNPLDFRLQYAAHTLTRGTARGEQMLTMKEGPLGTLNVGQVYEWYVRGPQGKRNDRSGLSMHPFHTHVYPFQIVSMESKDPFFMPGDWQDTLLHGSGQALIKFQTNEFTGHMIVHCHLLDHEDMGMMSYFNVKGKEGSWWEKAKEIDPTCYRDPSGVGFEMLSTTALLQKAATPPQWVKSEPGSNCHVACADYGGCIAEKAGAEELQAALQQMNVTCSKIEASDEDHAPSLLQSGGCTSGFSGDGHCGVIAPDDVSRFCRCHGIQQ